jgi:putative heme-binding domain-containing protein
VRRGDAEAVDEALEVIADGGAERSRRLELIRAFGEVDRPTCVPFLLKVAAGGGAAASLRKAALNALQRYNQAKIGERVVELYADLPGSVRSAAEALLASRSSWSKRLAEAVQAGRIEAEAIPDQIVEQMKLHDDAELQEMLAAAWGEEAGGAEGERSNRDSIESIRDVLKAGSGNLYRGKRIFGNVCGTCHRLFNEGGRIGPDLTSYAREDVEGMIRNILHPSAEIREGYETYAVITEDGRTVTGFLTDRSDRSLAIRGLDGQDVMLPRDKVERTRPLGRSLMPEGLLDGLSDQQIRDLFAYLRTSQPVPER